MSATTFSRLPRAARRIPKGVLASRLARALATPYGVDRFLELVDPAWSVDEVRARVLAVRHQSSDTVTLTLEANSNWGGFRAGQYVNVGVEVDGRRHTRCFSPAGSQHAPEETLELTVKVNPDGIVSRHLHDRAQPGHVVTLSQAAGEFVLPGVRPRRILLVCGGSGITPVMSMLRTLDDEGYRGHVTFLQYACTTDDVLYRDELADIARRRPGFDVFLALTHQRGAPEADLEGFFSRDHLASVAPDHADAQTFVCGPAPLMDSLAERWDADGIGHRLHREAFVPAVTTAAAGPSGIPTGATVSFTASGVEAADTGATLLDQAEAAGLRPETGCRMGICHTCSSHKSAGVVRDVVTGELSGSDAEAIRLCVSAPVGDVAVDI